jgi:hypothetical protein
LDRLIVGGIQDQERQMQTSDTAHELLVLGDANEETNSPTGFQEQELNPDEKYDE